MPLCCGNLQSITAIDNNFVNCYLITIRLYLDYLWIPVYSNQFIGNSIICDKPMTVNSRIIIANLSLAMQGLLN